MRSTAGQVCNTTDKAQADSSCARFAGQRLRRETSTMPQWAGSCWYYLRYVQPRNGERLVDPAAERYWLPVDLYVGARTPVTLPI